MSENKEVLKHEFERTVHNGQRYVCLRIEGACVAERGERWSGMPGNELERRCKAKLDEWVAEEEAKKALEPLTNECLVLASQDCGWEWEDDDCAGDMLRAVVDANNARTNEIVKQKLAGLEGDARDAEELRVRRELCK